MLDINACSKADGSQLSLLLGTVTEKNNGETVELSRFSLSLRTEGSHERRRQSKMGEICEMGCELGVKE